MKKISILSRVLSLFLALSAFCLLPDRSYANPSLGSASSFAVLSGSSVTNTGTTSIVGDVGVSPAGASISGFPPGIVTSGSIHSPDAATATALSDATAAFTQLGALTPTLDLSGTDLGGLTLYPGVYYFSSSAELTGTLTLSGSGEASPLFVFQIGSTFVTAANALIVTTDGADASNIFFNVGSSTTVGINAALAGTIIAYASDTLTTGASVDGRVIALTGAVTLDTNDITIPHPTTSTTSVPEPSSVIGLIVALASIVFLMKSARKVTV